jgi:hypothetical protein
VRAAGVSLPDFPRQDLELRGRKNALTVVAVKDARSLELAAKPGSA